MMGPFMRRSELLQFRHGADYYRYTFDSRDIVYQGHAFTAVAGLGRDKLRRSADPLQSQLTINAPLDLEVVGLWLPRPTTAQVEVTLLSIWKGDASAQVRFSGRVAGVKAKSIVKGVITCNPISADTAANGLTRNWQKQCPLRLYSVGLGLCNADPNKRRIDATVTASDGVTLKAAAWATRDDGDFAGGFVQWQAQGRVHQRFVVDHAGDTLTLLTPAAVPVGAIASAFSGCDHTDGPGGCGKFGNHINFGGQKNIPEKNPMGSNPIF